MTGDNPVFKIVEKGVGDAVGHLPAYFIKAVIVHISVVRVEVTDYFFFCGVVVGFYGRGGGVGDLRDCAVVEIVVIPQIECELLARGQ